MSATIYLPSLSVVPIFIYPVQDNSLSNLREALSVESGEDNCHSLRPILEQQLQTVEATSSCEPMILPYKRFTNRIRTKTGHPTGQAVIYAQAISKDPAFQEYVNHLKDIRENKGHANPNTVQDARSAVRHFLNYVGLQITNHTLNDLVRYKRQNPNSSDIERAVKSLSNEEPIRFRRQQATYILGIFRANYTPLNLRIDNHFDPAEENCTEGIFREIYSRLTPEQQDIIQWGFYFPQRAKAAYRIPLDEIDLSRSDYAVIWVQPRHKDYPNKAKVTHPALIPINFAKKVVTSAKAAGRRTVFPNHESQWKQITAFAKQEYKVKLISTYPRKLFEAKADQSKIPPAISAFLMGDKTKINATGHLPLFYNPLLRPKFIEDLIKEYCNSGLEHLLNLSETTNPKQPAEAETIQSLKSKIAELERQLVLKQ